MVEGIERLLNEGCERLLEADDHYSLSDHSTGRKELRAALSDIYEALDQAQRSAEESKRQQDTCTACIIWCNDVINGRSLVVRDFSRELFDLRLTMAGMAAARLMEELRLNDVQNAKSEAQKLLGILDSAHFATTEAWCQEILRIETPDLRSLEEMYSDPEGGPQPKRARTDLSNN